MKKIFVRLFWPILAPFERDADASGYRASHRKVLLAVGFLFLVLSAASLYFALQAGQMGAWLPIVLFFVVGLVSGVVGLLGSDGAVARIWGNR